MHFGILGPLEVRTEAGLVHVGGRRPRALLGLLLLHPDQPVSPERIAVALWGEDAPAGAIKTVQVNVARLRRALGDPDALVTSPAGYRLRVGPGELDSERFVAQLEDGRRLLDAGAPDRARDVLRSALALWRGPPLADLAFEPFAQGEIARLGELRLVALEARIEADLAAGRDAGLAGELERLVEEHPLRERLHGQLMLALYRSGRQAAALEAYGRARETLVSELGIEPGPELQSLQREILAQSPGLAPAPAPAPAPAYRLPLPPNATLGREGDLLAARDALQRTRLLTLTGPGGVGKTRVALELAHSLAPELADGARFISLAPLAAARHVPGAIADALGVVPAAGETAAQALARTLAGSHMLLVLDNFEHLLDAAPLVAELLAGTERLQILVTSRGPLRVSGESVLAVTPLASGAAAALFSERARAAGTGASADPEVIAAICARLDGLPLAIELAATRVSVLPPRTLLRRLDHRLELLTTGVRDADPRQRTLEATIDWSHELLDAGARTLLRRLAVFRGGCTLDTAAEVCGGDALLDAALALVDHGLLQRDGEPRFSMLETIREYATARLVESGEEAAIRLRHAECFTAVAERLGPAARTAADVAPIDELDAEHDNLRAAFDWAADARRHDLALRLAAALWWFWYARGHSVEALARLDRALGEGAAAATPARVEALLGRAFLSAWLGHTKTAEADAAALLDLADATGDLGLRVKAVHRLGLAAHLRGDYGRAFAMHEQAAELARQSDDDEELSMALVNLGDIALLERRFERAAEISAEAVERRRGLGNSERLASARTNLGSALLGLGRASEAAEQFRASARTAEEIGHAEGVGYALDGLAAAEAALGHPEHAARLLGAADAALDEAHASLQAFELLRREAVIKRLTRELGASHLEAARAAGRATPPFEAMDP